MKPQLEIDLEAIAATLLAASCSDLLAAPERLERICKLAGVQQDRVSTIREALRRIQSAGLN